MAHTYNPSYLGGCDQEDCTSRATQENSSKTPNPKYPEQKWTGGVVAQAVVCLLCKSEALKP
jgi:hypothetical protein